MFYPEFKNASRKHLVTCEVLIIRLKDISCEYKKKHILINIYYLSGYIFETIFKFAIFSSINYKKQEIITKLNQNGLNFDSDIKIHNLKKLKETLETKGIYRVVDYTKHKKLFNSWNSEIRYKENLLFSETEIINFFEFARKIFSDLNNYK